MNKACMLLGHRFQEGRVLRRTSHVQGEFRECFVLLECLRCGLLAEGRRMEIDRAQFPGGVQEWLGA